MLVTDGPNVNVDHLPHLNERDGTSGWAAEGRGLLDQVGRRWRRERRLDEIDRAMEDGGDGLD